MNILPLTESLIDDLAYVYPEPWKEEPWNEFFTFEEVEEIIRKAFERRGFMGFVSQNNERQVVGFTWGYLMSSKSIADYAGWNNRVNFSGDVFYLAEIGVLKDFRGEGIGFQLSKKLSEKATKPVILRTDSCAQSAISLYKKLGFTPLLSLSGKQITDVNHQSRLYWCLR
ncbi:MAG: GNAT family N-acetyltransferase [Candidatus Moranbacteria bacterium]|nr:GNAT family N-acetyltransferase [Candidatus Moranbacteria bacterium]